MHDEYDTDVRDEGFPRRYEILGEEGHSYGTEIGVRGYGQSDGIEIDPSSTDEIQLGAVMRTIAKARDNRRPAPPLRAVPVEEAEDIAVDEDLIGICGGADDDFPLTNSLFKQYSDGGGEPRIVRVDTEESYRQFRAQGSPEMAAFQQRVAEVEQKLAAHMADPSAHMSPAPALEGDIADLEQLGAEVAAAEEDKRIPLRMPKHFNGLVDAWHEGDFAAASLILPGANGNPLICTSMEPLQRGTLEAARAATEAGAPASVIVGYLPGIGATLAAASAIKDVASAAPSILRRPEARKNGPFLVRLQPKLSPALYTLAALSRRCAAGDAQACDEWKRLSANAAPAMKQAMTEIVEVMKPQATSVGGSWDSITSTVKTWVDKALGLFGIRRSQPTAQPTEPALPPELVKALAAAK